MPCIVLHLVQRKLTRSLFYRLPWSRSSVCPSYRTRCLLFGLEPLQHRRKTAQCLFIHKLVSGSLDAPSILSKLNFQAPSRMLRTRTLFNIEFRSTNFGSNDPLLKMISAYNSLGNNVYLNLNLNNLRTFLHSLIWHIQSLCCFFFGWLTVKFVFRCVFVSTVL